MTDTLYMSTGSEMFRRRKQRTTAFSWRNRYPLWQTQLRCIDPVYKEFIPADLIRRMGRIHQNGRCASKFCLRDAGTGRDATTAREIIPEAIITDRSGMHWGYREVPFLHDQKTTKIPHPYLIYPEHPQYGCRQIACCWKCHGYNSLMFTAEFHLKARLSMPWLICRWENSPMRWFGGQMNLRPILYHYFTAGVLETKANSNAEPAGWPATRNHCGKGASFLFLENQKKEHTTPESEGHHVSETGFSYGSQ